MIKRNAERLVFFYYQDLRVQIVLGQKAMFCCFNQLRTTLLLRNSLFEVRMHTLCYKINFLFDLGLFLQTSPYAFV